MAGGSSSRPPSAQTGPAQVGGLPPLSRLSLDAGRGEAGSAFPVRADVFLGSSEAPEHASAPELPSSDGRGLGLPGPAPQTRTAERDAPAFTAFRQPPSICGASSDCGSDCSCSTGSSVYEMPSDVLGLRDASAGSLDAGGCCGCCCIGEAKLDQELQELEDKVTSLGAEMVVQSAELAMADKRFAQIAEALQCSICLDTLGHPHSLACGHAFCQECLLQWLAHSKKCPTCRAPVTQRPAVAFAVQDIIRCVKPPTSGHEQPPAGAQSGPDPWALLFPPSTTVAASAAATVHTPLPNFVICTVCSRNMLEGEACVNCAIDALHRSITERLNARAAVLPPRQPPIQLSRLTRRRNEMLTSVDRLYESTRRLQSTIASSSTRAAPDRLPRLTGPGNPAYSAALDSSALLRDLQFQLREARRNYRVRPSSPSLEHLSPSPSPPESLFDPADLVGGRRSALAHPLPTQSGDREVADIDRYLSLATMANEDRLARRNARTSRPTRTPSPPPLGNASQAEYILRNGYESLRRVRVRSPSPRPTPAVAVAPPGSRRAHALQSRSLLNDYMLQLDDGDSTADDADDAEERSWLPWRLSRGRQ